MHVHHYKTTNTWIGNRGEGTAEYTSYDRNHIIQSVGKPELPCSSDPGFRGDKSRYNPEELLLASLSGCHMLWYLHLCAANNVIVVAYVDEAKGVMEENRNGSGQFREVVLQPRVTVKEKSMINKANELHHQANQMCFIARSVNFPVNHEPQAVAESL